MIRVFNRALKSEKKKYYLVLEIFKGESPIFWGHSGKIYCARMIFIDCFRTN